jgi:hypothetical protein
LQSYKISILIFALAFVLTGCAFDKPTSTPTSYTGNAVNNTPDQPAPNNTWHTNWLRKEPCAAPCWEGITPGITSVSAATNILEKNPLLTNVKLENSRVSWNWKESGKPGGFLDFSPKGILKITPVYWHTFGFGSLIDAFSEPTQVIASMANTGYVSYGISVIYRPQGLLLHYVGTIKPTLNRDLRFTAVIFFDPSPAGFSEAINHNETALTDWQGYKNFEFYCRDNAGRSCTLQ